MANGNYFDKIHALPFMLRRSKHERWFFRIKGLPSYYAEKTFHRTATVMARLNPIIHFTTPKSPSIRAKRFS